MIKKVEHGGERLAIHFKYKKVSDEKSGRDLEITFCRLISDGGAGATIRMAQGVAMQHPKDCPNRNVGRDTAFRRLMEDVRVNTDLPKEVRVALAESYRNRKGVKNATTKVAD